MNIKLLTINSLLLTFLTSSMLNADSSLKSESLNFTINQRFSDSNIGSTIFVEPQIEKYVTNIGWYYTPTCTPASSGTIAIEKNPAYGSLRFATENYPLPASTGICAGKIISGIAVYYTSNQNSIPSLTDTFKLRWNLATSSYSRAPASSI